MKAIVSSSRVAVTLVLAACAQMGTARSADSGVGLSAYDQAVARFDSEDFAGADSILRWLAGSCRSGNDGKRSLLLLSAMWLDPRNTNANADSAAAVAALVFSLPDANRLDRAMARSLYVLALEFGADAPRSGVPVATTGYARSFSRCDEPVRATNAALPALEHEPLAATIRRLERQRDSLSTRAKELQTELQTAQVEIQRIRRLLGGRDTALRVPPRP